MADNLKFSRGLKILFGVTALFLAAAIAISVENHINTEKKEEVIESPGTVAWTEQYDMPAGAWTHARVFYCSFSARLDDGRVVQCGAGKKNDGTPVEYCPGTVQLCNDYTPGMRVIVRYRLITSTNNSLFGDGKPKEEVDKILSILPAAKEAEGG